MPSDDLFRLTRWLDAGGAWRLTRFSTNAADLDLVTCSGGEVMESFTSSAADLLAYVSASVAEATPPTDSQAPRTGDRASG